MSRFLRLNKARRVMLFLSVIGVLILLSALSAVIFWSPGARAHRNAELIESLGGSAKVGIAPDDEQSSLTQWINDHFPEHFRYRFASFAKYHFDDRIYAVAFEGKSFQDEHLGLVDNDGSLRHLVIWDSQVTSEGLAKYLRRGPRRLRQLVIRNVPLESSFIEALCNMEVDKLGLLRSSLKGPDLVKLSVCSPTHLEACQVPLTVADMRLLCDLQLSSLALRDCGLTDEHFEFFAGSRLSSTIRELELDGNTIGENGLRSIALAMHLESVSFRNTDAPEMGIREVLIRHGRSLVAADFSYTRFDDSNLKLLAQSYELETLRLAGTRVSDKAASEFFSGAWHPEYLEPRSPVRPRIIDLSGTQVGDLTVKAILDKYPQLIDEVNVSQCDVSDIAFSGKGGHVGLFDIIAVGTKMTDASVPRIIGFNALRIDVRGTRMSPKGVSVLERAERIVAHSKTGGVCRSSIYASE